MQFIPILLVHLRVLNEQLEFPQSTVPLVDLVQSLKAKALIPTGLQLGASTTFNLQPSGMSMALVDVTTAAHHTLNAGLTGALTKASPSEVNM